MSTHTFGVDVSALAQGIISARRDATARPVRLPAEADVSFAEAYAVQASVAKAIGPVGGFKVANKPGAPRIMAPIFKAEIWPSGHFLRVPADEEIGIELEVGFRIDAPLPPRGAEGRRERIAACLSAVAVIEIVRTRIAGAPTAALKLADNQINGGLVVGAPVRNWQGLNLGRVDARLELGDRTVLDGPAEVPGGDAFENFLVLEEMVVDHCGGLAPGHVVITGSLNGLPYVQADLSVRGTIAGLGPVSVDLLRAN